MMTELLPCPFCGGEAETHATYDIETDAVDGWFAWCNNDGCECNPETREYITEAEAIAAWNTRYHSTFEETVIKAWQEIKEYQERTCRAELNEERNAVICSACGSPMVLKGWEEFHDWSGTTRISTFTTYPHCPNCGAKVVEQ